MPSGSAHCGHWQRHALLGARWFGHVGSWLLLMGVAAVHHVKRVTQQGIVG